MLAGSVPPGWSEGNEPGERYARGTPNVWSILSGDEDVDNSTLNRADLWVGTFESFESAFRKAALADAVAELRLDYPNAKIAVSDLFVLDRWPQRIFKQLAD